MRHGTDERWVSGLAGREVARTERVEYQVNRLGDLLTLTQVSREGRDEFSYHVDIWQLELGATLLANRSKGRTLSRYLQYVRWRII